MGDERTFPWSFVVNGVSRASRFLLGTRAPSFRPREYPVAAAARTGTSSFRERKLGTPGLLTLRSPHMR